jgi:hypothetical protein
MNGKAINNICIERFWRGDKREMIALSFTIIADFRKY